MQITLRSGNWRYQVELLEGIPYPSSISSSSLSCSHTQEKTSVPSYQILWEKWIILEESLYKGHHPEA